jgi:hypothetical protein
VTHIIFTSLDRFSREQSTEFGKRLDILADKGIDLLICTDLARKYDLSKQSIRDELIKKSEYSYMVSVQTAETVVVRKRSRAKNMLIPPAPAFGYAVDKGNEKRADGKRINGRWKVLPQNEELMAISECGNMFINGDSTTAIVKHMAGTGLLLRSAKYPEGNSKTGWTWASLKRILTNPIYCGDYVQFKWKCGKLRAAGKSFNVEDYSIHRKKGSAERFKTRMEIQPQENQTIIRLEDQRDGDFNNLSAVAIFSREEHDKITARVKLKHKGVGTRGSLKKNLLTSKGKCGHCGGPLFGYVSKSKDQYIYYYCSNARNSPEKCPGGTKTVKESELLQDVFANYYANCSDDVDTVKKECVEKLKDMSKSGNYRELKKQLADWKEYKFGLIDGGKLNSGDFEQAERRIAEIQHQMENLTFSASLVPERYEGDEFSLTSEIVAITQGASTTNLQKKARDLEVSLETIQYSQPLIDDVLESFQVSWIVGEGHNKTANVNIKYRLGSSATTFTKQWMETQQNLIAQTG